MSQLQQLELQRDGVQMIHAVLSTEEIADWNQQLSERLAADLAAIKNRGGAVYAARNILDNLPDDCRIWRRSAVHDFLSQTLGADYGLVRGLYFDKHPERTWSLPWHKDMTIAVKDNSISSQHFTKPTVKSGVPHVEAPESVLQNMLTLRVHLDEVTDDNGPLEVVLGSHHNGKQVAADHQSEKMYAAAGDILAMRPLISHASGSSAPNTKLHRRILHFEFAGDKVLPDGFNWFKFLPGSLD